MKQLVVQDCDNWKGKINKGSPLIAPPSHLDAIPGSAEREGIQVEPKSLCVEKTEIKVLGSAKIFKVMSWRGRSYA